MPHHPSRITSFFSELKRRRVFRVAAFYAAASWLLIQWADIVLPRLGISEEAVTIVIVLALLGFPAAMVLAWVYDLTSRGLVKTESPPDSPESAPQPEAPPRRRWVAPATRPEPGKIRSVAVLPFVDMSPARDQEYFSDGITEELLNVLARVDGLRVPARTSSFAFKGTSTDVREIGDRLEVEAVLEGSVRTHGNRVRITAQLISAADGYHLWSETYDRDLQDIFAVQEEIARSIVQRVVTPRSGKRAAPRVKTATADTDAYRLYLRGLYAWNRRTGESLRQAVGCFQEAIEEDPLYAEAHAGAANAYLLLGYFGYLPPHEVYPRAKAAALSALGMDDSLAAAHTAFAAVQLWYDWDWEGAERSFQRALELEPHYPTAHHWYGGGYLTTMGRMDEAIAELQSAHRLDPLSLIIPTGLGRVLYWARRWDEAAVQFRQTLELNPDFVVARAWLGSTYLQMGRVAEAVEELRAAAATAPRNPLVRTELARALARAGQQDDARALLQELRAEAETTYVSPDFLALVHAGLGEAETALTLLERAYQDRATALVTLRIEPAFDPLRGDARFHDLLSRVGLP